MLVRQPKTSYLVDTPRPRGLAQTSNQQKIISMPRSRSGSADEVEHKLIVKTTFVPLAVRKKMKKRKSDSHIVVCTRSSCDLPQRQSEEESEIPAGVRCNERRCNLPKRSISMGAPQNKMICTNGVCMLPTRLED